MNQMCKVCGEPAAGFHFGAFTCEGCKSFFGRTYNNLSSISECKNNGECIINKKNRTSCKACRLRKCLLVGMSKSGSRYGRRSNWFKIHCLLQEQQNKSNSNNNNNIGSNNSNSNNVIQNSAASNNSGSSASLLQNDFISSHFLASLYNNYNDSKSNGRKIPEIIKRMSSPSDSGASSADPDDTSLKFNNNTTTKNNNISLSYSARRNSVNGKKSELISPEDECTSPVNSTPMKASSIPPFLPFPLVPHPSLSSLSRTSSTQELFMLSLPHISLVPNYQNQLQKSAPARKLDSNYDNEQYEPIDLSTKSLQNRRIRSDSDNEKSTRPSSLSPIHEEVAASTTKTVPLDLTLVRSG